MGGGGAEVQLVYLAATQSRKGNDVHVMLAARGVHADRLEKAGVTVHGLSGRNNYDPAVIMQASNLVRRLRPDVVQTWLPQMDVIGALVAHRNRAPWILSERASAAAYPGIWKYRLRAFLARRADGIVSNSAAGSAYWQNRVGERVRRWVVPNAVPLEEIELVTASEPSEPAGSPGSSFVLFVGRLSPDKNVENLIRGVALARKHVPVRAILCGTGPWESGLRLLTRELDLEEDVRFAGYVSPIWPWMKRASALALVSRLEGEPNAALEAIACRCPVILSDIPAHRDLLDENGAIFVNPESVEDIARGLVQSLQDPEGARLRAESARRCLENRSLESVADRYWEIYESVIFEGNRP